jgi:hypothetical protein
LDIQTAATKAFGRRWGHDTERFRRPNETTIPDLRDLPVFLHHPFIEGYAEAIGEMWGHGTSLATGIPEKAETVWLQGQEKGIQRWWLSPIRLFPEYPVRR